MKILSFSQLLRIDNGILLHPHNKYVMSDHFAKQLLDSSSHVLEVIEDFDPQYKPLPHNIDLTDKKLLIWRSGGIGDLLFITPNIKYLLDKYRGLQVKLACAAKYLPLFADHELLYDGRAYPMPFPAELLDWADYHLHFEGIIESGGKAEYTHAIDLFSEYFGIRDKIPEELRRPVLPPTRAIDNKMKNVMRYKLGVIPDKPTIAFQFRASAPIRTFPKRRVIKIATHFANQYDCNCIILDAPWAAQDIDKYIRGIELTHGVIANGAKFIRNITESIALIKKVDLLVAPDSSLCHIAGAIGVDVPTLALYGPFPSFVRTKYYKKCIAIDAKWGCAPCYKHGHKPCPEANQDGESPCFQDIKDHDVIFFMRKMLGLK